MNGYTYIKSGIGGEVTDRVVATGPSHPPWTLAPIPLARVRPPGIDQHRGPARSLGSYCLAVVSRELHTVEPLTLAALAPPLVARVAARIRADRGYDAVPAGSRRPDEATLWALTALADPAAADDFTLELPACATLAWLRPVRGMPGYEHPLTALPKLFASLHPAAPYEHLTTLSLSSARGDVDDASIQALAACTHLAVLWTRGSKVTDAGVRLLAAALDLPGTSCGGRGLRRLRAWYLSGSAGVSDRSTRSFARFPGLVLLDVRDTSCTAAALPVLNRASHALFPAHAAFQPATPGLRVLFSRRPPARTLADLRGSLTRPADPAARHIALHIAPSPDDIPDAWLAVPPTRKPMRADRPSRSAFIGAGVGQLYGVGVGEVHDEQRALRNEVAENLVRRTAAAYRAASDYKAGGLSAQREREVRGLPHVLGRSRMDAGGADERSRAFVMGPASCHEDEVKGDAALMMVRMVDDGWDVLRWAAPGAQAPVKTARRPDALVATLGTPTPSAFRPTVHAASSPATPARPSQNPFRQAGPVSGVRPLAAAASTPTPLTGAPPTARHADFSPTSRKRSFSGDAAAPPKRSQLKMFKHP